MGVQSAGSSLRGMTLRRLDIACLAETSMENTFPQRNEQASKIQWLGPAGKTSCSLRQRSSSAHCGQNLGGRVGSSPKCGPTWPEGISWPSAGRRSFRQGWCHWHANSEATRCAQLQWKLTRWVWPQASRKPEKAPPTPLKALMTRTSISRGPAQRHASNGKVAVLKGWYLCQRQCHEPTLLFLARSSIYK